MHSISRDSPRFHLAGVSKDRLPVFCNDSRGVASSTKRWAETESLRLSALCGGRAAVCQTHNLATRLGVLGLLLSTLGLALGVVPLVRSAATSCLPQNISRDPRYPAHWWTPIVDPKKPDWEILPQEAGPGEVILSKRNELGLLSNFAATPFVFHGRRYASLEGFWQMMKYPEGPDDIRAKFAGLEWNYTREQVAQMIGFEANHAGSLANDNMKKMSITWVSFEGKQFEYRPAVPGEHYHLIVAATWEKVRQNPEVKKVLLATGDLILKPDHHQEANAPAAWHYYEILMQIRSELQKKKITRVPAKRGHVERHEAPRQ